MRRLHHIIKGESRFDDLLQRHRHEAALQDRIQRLLPPALAKMVAVVDARFEELELGAASGAAAALLRRRAPELQAALVREGFEFTGIRVRVQARLAREPDQIPSRKQLDSASVSIISSLAAQLGTSALADALRRLAGTRRRGDALAEPAASSGRGDQPLDSVKDQDREQ